MNGLYFPQFSYAPSDILSRLERKYVLLNSLVYSPNVVAAFVRPPEILTEQHLALFPNLTLVVSDTTGVSHLTLAEQYGHLTCRTLRSIPKSTLTNITAAADHAINLLSLSLRPTLQAYYSSKPTTLQEPLSRTDYLGLAWQDVTLGIIGFGRIGQYVASYLPPSLSKVCFYDTDTSQPKHKLLVSRDIRRCSSLNQLLALSNVVLISVTDNRDTNTNILSNILLNHKLHSIVNISRPYVVDEAFVLSALRENRLGYYYSDFPLKPLLSGDSSLHACGRILGLPHMGGCTQYSWHQSIRLIAESFLL